MSAPRIVLDTNVLISAIVFGGKPREVLEKVIAGWYTMAISAEMPAEFQSVRGGMLDKTGIATSACKWPSEGEVTNGIVPRPG